MPQDCRRGPVRRARAAGVAVLLLAPVAGCAPLEAHSATCVDWVRFDSPADALAAATLAVRTDGQAPRSGATGTTELFGVDSAVHTVRVAAVLRGTGVRAGEDLEVISTPVTCSGDVAYPDGDPLDASGDLVLLLQHDADVGAWRTITPAQAVLPAGADGGLPSTAG